MPLRAGKDWTKLRENLSSEVRQLFRYADIGYMAKIVGELLSVALKTVFYYAAMGG